MRSNPKVVSGLNESKYSERDSWPSECMWSVSLGTCASAPCAAIYQILFLAKGKQWEEMPQGYLRVGRWA